MSNLNSTHLMMLSGMLVLAGCSSAVSREPTNTAVVTQSGPDLAASYDVQSASGEPVLDGAPPAVVPETYAPQARVHQPAQKRTSGQGLGRVDCDLDIDRTPSGIRITPVVHADRSLAGEYSLVITKTGGGNSSDISQGGPFDVSRGGSVRLGSSEFSMERGAKFRATLKVRANGREVCRDVRS